MFVKHGCVTLRAIEETDAELLRELMNSPEVENMTEGWHHPISAAAQKKWVESYVNTDTNIRFMIELANGATIGMVGLSDIDWKNRSAAINMKTTVLMENRMKGDLRDAMEGLLKYAFSELNLHCLWGQTLSYNTFALKLTDSLGFVREGTLRKRLYKNGKYHDQICIGLLKEDYEETLSKNNG